MGAVQTRALDADDNQALVLKRFKNPVENSLFGPSAKPHLDGVPIAVLFRQAVPLAAILRNIEQGIKQAPAIDFHVAALQRQELRQHRILSIRQFCSK
ncbi:hypothetical protein [Pseudochelatococcus contaminans]|uniref:Uncharacterized protein n=1 Tax=Pseudochelatococcus contaminans TaxID=1538103 RepID=A0A7W5Z6I2_9HYPH|nr:hypothetical protein [Pseudochelatococcus contaminans]